MFRAILYSGLILSSGLFANDGPQFWAEGNFLYVRPSVDGLSIAQRLDATLENSPTQKVDARTRQEDLNFKWEPGFKVGVGFTTSCPSRVEVGAFWTSFNARAHKDVVVQDFDHDIRNLRPIWINIILGDTADAANGRWKMDFNVVDLAVRREFDCCSWLTIRPEVSIRGVGIKQHYLAQYHSFFHFIVNGGENFYIGRDTSFNGRQSFYGAGVRAGSDIRCPIGGGLRVTGNGYASLLYGQFKRYQEFDGAISIADDIGAPSVIPEMVSVKDRYQTVRPALETELGLEWEKSFCQDRFKLLIGAYYQLSFWFRQNEFVNEFSSRSVVPLAQSVLAIDQPTMYVNMEGNLSYQGGRFQVAIAF